MDKINPNNNITIEYFLTPTNTNHKQYLAMRAFFVDRISAREVASKFGYAISTVYSMVRDFKNILKNGTYEDPFFKPVVFGRKPIDSNGDIIDIIVNMRKNNMSVPQIKTALDANGTPVSERYITSQLRSEGFARLPRRDKNEKENVRI
jgi:transposase